jgi:hypothetical protein
MMIRRRFLAISATLLLAAAYAGPASGFAAGSTAAPAAAADSTGAVECHSPPTAHVNSSHRQRLWDGYEVSLGPTGHDVANDAYCTAAIYDRAGKVVFRTTGYNVIFDQKSTGLDFDDDGKPDVVFETDTGGGMHCCWTYNVVSLSPHPHRLFDVEARGAVRFERDSQGRVVIWQRVAGPHGFTSNALAPFAEKVLRFRADRLVDVTPDFCFRILGDKSEDHRSQQRVLTSAALARFQANGKIGYENEETISALLGRALQHVFCRRFEQASSDLDQWPEASRAKMKRDFAQSIKADYPDFAAALLAGKN